MEKAEGRYGLTGHVFGHPIGVFVYHWLLGVLAAVVAMRKRSPRNASQEKWDGTHLS
jgi:hypothetical protein